MYIGFSFFTRDCFRTRPEVGSYCLSCRIFVKPGLASKWAYKKCRRGVLLLGRGAWTGLGAALLRCMLAPPFTSPRVHVRTSYDVWESHSRVGNGVSSLSSPRWTTRTRHGGAGCCQGVARAHVVPPASGALLQELYTRDGAGLLISRDM